MDQYRLAVRYNNLRKIYGPGYTDAELDRIHAEHQGFVWPGPPRSHNMPFTARNERLQDVSHAMPNFVSPTYPVPNARQAPGSVMFNYDPQPSYSSVQNYSQPPRFSRAGRSSPDRGQDHYEPERSRPRRGRSSSRSNRDRPRREASSSLVRRRSLSTSRGRYSSPPARRSRCRSPRPRRYSRYSRERSRTRSPERNVRFASRSRNQDSQVIAKVHADSPSRNVKASQPPTSVREAAEVGAVFTNPQLEALQLEVRQLQQDYKKMAEENNQLKELLQQLNTRSDGENKATRAKSDMAVAQIDEQKKSITQLADKIVAAQSENFDMKLEISRGKTRQSLLELRISQESTRLDVGVADGKRLAGTVVELQKRVSEESKRIDAGIADGKRLVEATAAEFQRLSERT